MLKYVWDQQKNELLKRTRGICFRDVVELLNKKEVIGELPHHNPNKYPNQRIYILRINHYIYVIPYVRINNIVTLKTIYPSRKLNNHYKE